MSQFTASDGEEQNTPGKKDAATHEASAVASTTRDAAHSVVETGAQEAAAVAGVAKERFGDLVSQTGRELSDQAAGQQQRLAAGLGSMGDDLSRMADADESSGMAGEIVRRAATHVSSVASWLGDRDPQQVLQDVTRFARRRPGTFIAVAAITGVVVGRLSRALAAGATSTSGSTTPTGPRFTGTQTSAGTAQTSAATVPPVPGPAAVVASDRSPDPVDPDLDDTGLVTGVGREVDGGDPPLYTESAARLSATPEGVTDERRDTL